MLANVSRRVVATAIPRPAIRDQFALTSSTGSTIVARHRIKFHKLPADYRRRTGRRDMQEGYIPTAMQYLRSLEPDYLPDSGPQKRPKKRLHALNPFIKVSAREQVELRNHVDFMGMKLDKQRQLSGTEEQMKREVEEIARQIEMKNEDQVREVTRAEQKAKDERKAMLAARRLKRGTKQPTEDMSRKGKKGKGKKSKPEKEEVETDDN